MCSRDCLPHQLNYIFCVLLFTYLLTYVVFVGRTFDKQLQLDNFPANQLHNLWTCAVKTLATLTKLDILCHTEYVTKVDINSGFHQHTIWPNNVLPLSVTMSK